MQVHTGKRSVTVVHPCGISIECSRIWDDPRQGLSAEVEVCTVPPLAHSKLWGPVRAALTNPRDIRELVEDCKRLTPHGQDIGWEDIVVPALQMILVAWRADREPLDLSKVAPKPPSWVIDKFCAEGETTLLAADGQSGKSLVALGLAVSVCTGLPIVSKRLEPTSAGKVLYVDWETHSSVQADRLHRICRGAGISVEELSGALFYMQEFRSVAERAEDIARWCEREDIALVIVDSALFAAHGETERSEAAINFCNAMNSIGRPARLALSHISKGERAKASGRQAYGSVMFFNGVRNEWQMRSAMEPGANEVRMAFEHTKANNTGRQEPFGVSVVFSDGAITFEAMDLATDPELGQVAPLPERIIAVMTTSVAPMTANDIAETLDCPSNTVRATLHRMQRSGRVVRHTATQGGASLWGLPDRTYSYDMAGNPVGMEAGEDG